MALNLERWDHGRSPARHGKALCVFLWVMGPPGELQVTGSCVYFRNIVPILICSGLILKHGWPTGPSATFISIIFRVSVVWSRELSQKSLSISYLKMRRPLLSQWRFGNTDDTFQLLWFGDCSWHQEGRGQGCFKTPRKARTTQTTRNDLIQAVNSASVEKPCYTLMKEEAKWSSEGKSVSSNRKTPEVGEASDHHCGKLSKHCLMATALNIYISGKLSVQKVGCVSST